MLISRKQIRQQKVAGVLTPILDTCDQLTSHKLYKILIRFQTNLFIVYFNSYMYLQLHLSLQHGASGVGGHLVLRRVEEALKEEFNSVCQQGAPVKGAEPKRRPATHRTAHVCYNNNT